MKRPGYSDMSVSAEASEWVTRFMVEAPENHREEFIDWLCQSPRHIDEFLIAKYIVSSLERNYDPQRQIDVAEMIREASNKIIPLREPMTIATRPEQAAQPASEATPSGAPILRGVSSRYRHCRIAAIAAVAAAVGASVLGLLVTSAATYTTGLGEQRTVRLSDGSFISLNTRSSVRVQFSKGVRSVRLIEGEALFKVAHDEKRPFLVSTPAATIRAVGTQFDVYLASKTDTRVAVVEGRVEVSGDLAALPSIGSPSAEPERKGIDLIPPRMLLAAGEQATVTVQGAVVKSVQPDVSRAVAWRNGKLVFQDAPLADVVKEFGRYSDFQFKLVGDGLAQRKITAVFRPDDPQMLLSLLERDNTVELKHVTNGVVVKLR